MATRISTAECQVMEALWRGPPLSAEEIISAVGPPNDWQAGTVRTLISRLLGKKAIAGRKEKVGYLYRPLISRADYVAEESQGFLDRLFGGQLAPMVAHFAQHGQLTAKDVRKLKALIRELGKEGE